MFRLFDTRIIKPKCFVMCGKTKYSLDSISVRQSIFTTQANPFVGEVCKPKYTLKKFELMKDGVLVESNEMLNVLRNKLNRKECYFTENLKGVYRNDEESILDLLKMLVMFYDSITNEHRYEQSEFVKVRSN